MSDSLSVLVTRTIHAAPAEVYRGFTQATMLRDWLCHVSSTEPHKGGHLFLRWHDGRTVTGTYQKIDLPNEIRFTWLDSDLPVPTEVTVTCRAEGEDTILTLMHSGEQNLGAGPGLEAFWTIALENLASVIETGIDLRHARRPRLGIAMDEFTPQVAEKLKVPVKEGVLLAATAEGTGARAAGLLKDDVLVSLNGVPISGTNSFEVALRGLKAGDTPVVEYYRGPEKCSVPLQLGSFPVPQLPATAKELAAKVRELNTRVLEAMNLQLQGLSEEQASARPEEGEWSVKELVAHFTLAERDFQSWVADMLNDTPIEDWLMMRSNVQPRITALTNRLQTLPALLEDLVQAKDETFAMIEAFPETFASHRKHLYRRVAGWVMDVHPTHYYEEHKEQFQKAIQASR